MEIYIVTVDGRAQDRVYTNLVSLVEDFPVLPYSAIRTALKAGNERVYVKGNVMYRINRAEVIKIIGRGGNNLKGRK